MVFESIITTVMNRFLGDFIEGLDGKQLNLGIWGGDVVLKNLKLKQDALKELDLPIQTVYGRLGTLVLKIPWQDLYKMPVVVTIEDLYLLVAPNAAVGYNAIKQANADYDAKRAALQKLEELRTLELNKDNKTAAGDKSFVEKMIAQIINNVQIKITNVHIRYEDQTTSAVPFALGITLGSLEVHTTDADWQKTFLKTALSKVFKVAKLDGLAVYMNCHTAMFQSEPVERYSEMFLETIARMDHRPENYSYVLGPINALAKLKMNVNPEHDSPPYGTPKFDLFLEMQKLAVGVTKAQYQRLVAVADGFGAMTRGLPYRQYRPHQKSVHGNAKLWWQFAYTCIVETDIRRRKKEWSWTTISTHRALCRRYADAYEKKIVSRKVVKEQVVLCEELENQLDLFNLKMIRQQVDVMVDRSGVLDVPEAPTSWFGGWWGGKTESAAKGSSGDIKNQIKTAMTPEEKAKLCQAIGYIESDIVSVLPVEYVAFTAYFKLDMLEVFIRDEEKARVDVSYHPTVLSMQVNGVSCSVQQRPAASGLALDMRLNEFTILGQQRKDFVPTIVRSRLEDIAGGRSETLLDVSVELNPLDGRCDQRVRVSGRPLEIVYDAQTVIELLSIFKLSSDSYLAELGDAAAVELAGIKERSATGIQFMVDNKSRLDISISIMPNYVIIPHGGVYTENETNVIVLCLGQLTLKTEQTERLDVAAMHAAGLKPDEVMRQIRDQAYDKFTLDVQNVQVLVAVAGENWKEYLNRDEVTEMHIIEPIALHVEAAMCVVPDDPSLPKTRVSVKIPRIGVAIADERTLCAVALARSIPLPQSDTIEPRPLSKVGAAMSSSVSLRRFVDSANQRKAKPTPIVTAQDPTAELVQFTELELSFVMNELSVRLYRSSNRVASPGSPSYRTPPEEFASDRSPSTSGIGVRTPMSSISGDKSTYGVADGGRHFSLRVRQLELNMVQRTYDMKVALKLGAIAVNQLRPDDVVLPDLPIIETPTYKDQTGYLFTCHYTNANKASPEFNTRYKSIEQLIEIHFSVLNVRLHQERLVEMLQLVHAQRVVYEQMMESTIAATVTESGEAALEQQQQRDRVGYAGDSLARTALQTIAEEVVSSVQEPPTAVRSARTGRKSRHTVVDSVQLKLVASMERVAIVLECDRKTITELKIEQLHAGVIMKKSYTDVSLKLQDIIVTDPNALSIHPTIVRVIGGNALACQLVMYDLTETANYNSDNMQIDVSMGCVKIVFLNYFVTSVVQFFDPFQEAQEAIASAGAAAAEQAKQNMVMAYENAQRLRLNIQIKAPLILVPVDSKSREAIAIDFGNLAITNVCSEIANSAHEHGPAILDETKLELKDLKLSRVHIEADSDADLVSAAGHNKMSGLASAVDILSPTTFALLIRRNLSAGWYRQIPDLDVSARLKSIVMNMVHDDAQLVLSILAKNFSEGADQRQNVPAPVPKKAATSKMPLRGLAGKVNSSPVIHELLPLSGPKRVNDTFLKFTFQMDSVVVNLSSAPGVSFATFGIYHLSLKGYQLVDKSLFASIVLCDIQLDDCRPNRERMITKFMQKKNVPVETIAALAEDATDAVAVKPESTMLDIVVRITQSEMFVNLLVSSFDLILSLEFMMQLLQFVRLSDNETPAEDADCAAALGEENVPSAVQAVATRRATEAAAASKPSGQKMTVNLKIEKPDIILVEQMDNINSLALILNTQVELRVRIYDQQQIISGEIADFKMFVCEFNPARRGQTKHYVLHPCNLTLHAASPEATGMNISLTASDIRLNITPGTIDLLNKAMATFAGSSAATSALVAEIDHSDLWATKPFVEHRHWYMKVDGAEDALTVPDVQPESLPEVCIVEMPTILIVLETGFGYYTHPMLQLKSHMNAEIRDWSSDMSINSTLSLGMSYYNSTLAVWEPIIEPNECIQPNGLTAYSPWELKFRLQIEKNGDETQSERAEPKTKIVVSSSETLEMTVTRSCLDVLHDLSTAFSTALSSDGLHRPEDVAPYVVTNDTGFEVKLLLRDSRLVVHQSEAANTTLQRHSAPDDVLVLAPGDRAMLHLQTGQSTVSLTAVAQSEELFLNVRIGDIDKDVALPIHKADRRYFPLYRDTNQEPWGIISHVTTEYGSTLVTLHGVLLIENHFSTPIEVWRFRTSQMVHVGSIAPGEVFNVPLHALYVERKELYFSLAGYKTSVQGFSWTEHRSDFKYTKQLHCDPELTFEPFYMMAIRERHEIYHGTSTKHTMLSAYYVIHLHPPLYVRNALPVDLYVSVAGCSVAQTVDTGTEASELSLVGAAGDNGPPVVSSPTVTSTAAVAAAAARKAGCTDQQVDFLDYGEKVVRPGDILHLPTVKTMVKEGTNRSYIVARILQYLDRDWSCTTEIPSNPEEFAVWVFNSYDSVSKMTLQLGVKFDTSAGNLQLVVYCPYRMINKTGLMLSYRASDENVNVLYHPPDHNGPILFSFREKHFFGKKQASLRVESGTWSDKFALDAAGSTGKVECKFGKTTYQIAVNSTLTSNSLTKQIVFTPFFVMINKAPFALEVQEDQRPGDPWLRIEPASCAPLWPRVTNDPMLRVKTTDESQASVPFRYVTVQTTLLKLANKYGGINVDVQVSEGGTFIVFSEYHAGDAPALIINHTPSEVYFWERGNVNRRSVKPYHQMMYTWADPTGPRTVYWDEHDKNAESDLRRDGLNYYRTIDDAESSGAPASGYWVSFLDGTQRVLLFTDNFSIANGANSANRLDQVAQEIEFEIHGIGMSLVNNAKAVDIMYIGMASSQVIWEEQKRAQFYKALNIQDVHELEDQYQEYLRQRQVGAQLGNTFGLRDGSLVEMTDEGVFWRRSQGVKVIRRMFYPGLWVNIKSSPYQLQLHAKINRIQIDNQLVDCIFPVVLAPVPPPKSVAASTELKPFIECSIVQRVIPYSNVKQFKYMTVLIQEFHVKVDLLFINAIVDMLSTQLSEADALKLFHADIEREKEPLSALAISQSSQEQKNFYDELHLGPLKIHISFSMAGLETSALPGVLATILQGVGVTLTDVNDIVFKLAFFERNYQFYTQNQLTAEVTSHYAGLALKQAYVLILGLDVIGNPYGLVVGFTKGVEDLFYEPFQGAIQGPGEFAEGLVLGVRSLLGHTVGGAAGAVSKITGAMGKGLAVLTFDKAYQTKRRKQLNRKPANLQEGLAQSGKGLVMGVFDGVTGVITKPISGAKSEGVEGFFKGLGKGAVGLVARPTAGLVDFASGSFGAVKRATEMTEDVTRLRARRLMHSDGVVRPFSLLEAEGNRLLKEVDKGKYANSDAFVDFHAMDKRHQLLLTDQRILFCAKSDLFGGWQTEWTHRWSEITHVRIVEKGIELLLGEKSRKVMGLFGSSEQAKKLIVMARSVRQQQLFEAMHAQVRIAQETAR